MPPTEWHVYRAISNLPRTELINSAAARQKYLKVIENVIAVLNSWARRWCGDSNWQSFLNRKSFLHEVEEAIVPLTSLIEYTQLAAHNSVQVELVVMDMCCGKGFFGMILTYLANFYPLLKSMVKRIVCIEKNTDVKWSHFKEANLDFELNCSSNISSDLYACIPIDIWENTNIHSEAFEYKVLNYNVDGVCNKNESEVGSKLAGVSCAKIMRRTEVFLVGIHLCRRLSSRFIELNNLLMNNVTSASLAGSILAPCCLPRFGDQIYIRRKLNILNYKTYQSFQNDNMVWNKDMCWKCGSLEHVKADCTAPDAVISQNRKKRKLNQTKHMNGEGNPGPPEDYHTAPDDYFFVDMQLAQISQQPFQYWCNYLHSAIQCGICHSNDAGYIQTSGIYETTVIEADLVNSHLIQQPADTSMIHDKNNDLLRINNSISNNWNYNRKTTWIQCWKKM